ncbi:tyrosine--tRNA ligase [Fusibacter sp. JL216-2]|uniref:tyrosine--tRNA ligase n=1 Tax=Fusibacter sp. JL216-2 TaxID=3071453 RepID=UPI003D34630F
MTNVFDILQERGFIEQITHEEEVKELLAKESVTFYIGFDPTADSLHLGHFVQVMVMKHMQNAGHKPIALIGEGTAKVGDPTGKTDMRKMLTNNTLTDNGNAIRKQLEKYLVLDGEKGYVANNADWLDNLNYIEFLREIGSKFSVNRMLQAECFKQRMESGLTFLEFNYMIMQGYDFLELNRRYNCKMQLGGNDQWSNIIAGVELTRKMEQEQVFGLTFKLLTTSEGVKMGKTVAGALWIDPEKTTPFEMFQYLRNVEDADVENCLSLLTFLPMDEVRRLGALEGAEINKAKETLAFEFVKIVHGEEEAKKALEAAKALFAGGADMSNVPTTELEKSEFEGEGMGILDLMNKCGLAPSRSEARRNVQQGGVSINGEKITSIDRKITVEDFGDEGVLIKKGKKKFHRVLFA